MSFHPNPKPTPRQRPKLAERLLSDAFPDFEPDEAPAFQPDCEPAFEADLEPDIDPGGRNARTADLAEGK